MVPLSHPNLTCVSVSRKNHLTNTRTNMRRQSKNVQPGGGANGSCKVGVAIGRVGYNLGWAINELGM